MFANPRAGIRLLASLALAVGATALTGSGQASADALSAFTCTDKSGGQNGAPATVTAIRAAHHDGYDRLVFEFAGAVPQYELSRQSGSTFTRDASGQPVTLQGGAGIRTVLRNTDTAGDLGNDLQLQLSEIREVAQIGNFERVVSYGIGLKDAACFRAFELSGPGRLVIDVATPAGASMSSAPGTTGEPAASPAATAAQPSVPSGLAGTGHASESPSGNGPLFVRILLGLLAVAAGLAIAGGHWLAKR